MRNAGFFLTGLVLILVQANLFRFLLWTRIPGIVPSLTLPLIVFMGVHEYSPARGAAVAFAIGYLSDIVAGTPVGLYTFTSVVVFVLARGAGVRLAAQATWMQVLLAIGFAAAQSLLVLLLLAIFGRDRDGWVPRAVYPYALPRILTTALVAPFIFRLARRVDQATSRMRSDGGGL
jgi:rod shape-determining protein MreD